MENNKSGTGRNKLRRNTEQGGRGKAPKKPLNLKKPANPITSIREALETTTDEAGFFETVARAADKAGCEFLFEVPGALFSSPDTRAAAIRCGESTSIGEVFILFNRENGVIRLLTGDEVPDEVTRFVRSYAAVLVCLQESNRSRRIH